MPKVISETTRLRSEYISSFLKNKQWISIIGIERELNLPINTIHRAIKSGGIIPEKYLTKIELFMQNNLHY